MTASLGDIIDVRAALGDTNLEHVYGTVLSVIPETRRAMVDIGATGVGIPCAVPALPITLRPGHQVLVGRRKGLHAGGIPLVLAIFGEWPAPPSDQLDRPDSPAATVDYLARIKRAAAADYSGGAEIGLAVDDSPYLRLGDVYARRTGALAAVLDDGAAGAVALNVVGTLALNGTALAPPPTNPGFRFVPVIPSYVYTNAAVTDQAQTWTPAITAPAGTPFVQAEVVLYPAGTGLATLSLFHASALSDAALTAYSTGVANHYSANSGIIELGTGANALKLAWAATGTAGVYIRVVGYWTKEA
jgi:hypothetical protein